MKVLDIILIIIMLFGAWKGYQKGFFREIISFFVLFISVIVAFKYLNKGMEVLEEYVSDSVLLKLLAFILIFVAVLLAIHFLSKILKKILDLTFFGQIDNVAGAFLGMAKMAFITSILLWLIIHSKIMSFNEYSAGSYLYAPLVDFAPRLVHWTTLVIPFDDIFPIIKKYLTEA